MKFDLSKPVQLEQFNDRVKILKEKGAKVNITQHVKRSTSQNSYLHVIINLWAVQFGYTLAEAKTFLKRGCHFMVYEKNGIKFLAETSKLNVEVMTGCITWIRNHSSQQGYYLPSGKEYHQEKFYYDQMIDQHRQYL